MRICIIGTISSGMLHFRGGMIKDLVLLGHEVHVFCIDYTDHTRAKLINLGAFPQDYSLNRSGTNPFKDFISLISLYSSLRSIAPDTIISYFSKPVIYGTIAGFFAGVKHRYALIEGLGFAFTKQPYRLPFKTRLLKLTQIILYLISLPFAKKVFFLNEDDRTEMCSIVPFLRNKSYDIGGIGVDLASYPFSIPKSYPITFLFVGRLLNEKGIIEFIESALIVKRKYSNLVEFVVVGSLDDNPGSISKTRLDSLRSSGLVNFVGQVDDVVPYYTESSVFVLPSYREGCPRSTQEAMAIGRPVITTNVPGCRQTVVNGLNGYVVPPFSVPGLVDAMSRFVESPFILKQMGMESYIIAKSKFDIKRFNKELFRHLDII